MILQLYLTLAAVVVVSSACAASETLPVKCVRTLCETSYVGIGVNARQRAVCAVPCCTDDVSSCYDVRTVCLTDVSLPLCCSVGTVCPTDASLSLCCDVRTVCLTDVSLSLCCDVGTVCLTDVSLSLCCDVGTVCPTDVSPCCGVGTVCPTDVSPCCVGTVCPIDVSPYRGVRTVCLTNGVSTYRGCVRIVYLTTGVDIRQLTRVIMSGDESGEGAAAMAGPSYKPHAKPPGPVNIKSADRKDNWELHKQLWENYCILAGIENTEPRIQRAEFIHTLGPDTLYICNGLGLKSEDTVDEITKRTDEYCIGEVHEVMEQFNFNNRDQRPGESVNDYIAALRTLAKTCNFSGNKTNEVESTMIRNRIIQGIGNKTAQAKMLDKRNTSLNDVIDIARTVETTEKKQKLLCHASNPIHAVTGRSKKPLDQTRFKKKNKA